MKLIFSKNGVGQEVTIYNSKAEAGANSIELFENGFVALGEPSNELASYGILEINGKQKSILLHKEESGGGGGYTEKAFTEAGEFTFTVPAGISKLKVALCGGGAGGMIDSYFGYGESGGGYSSIFGNLRAGGGLTAYADYGGYGDGFDFATGAGTSNGEQGYALGFDGARGTYGAGGSATLSGDGQRGGGYAGKYRSEILDVTAGQNIHVVVGAGGEPAIGTSGDAKYGNSGFVLIAYGGDIK